MLSKRRREMGEKRWAEYQRNRKNSKALKWKANNPDKVIGWRINAKRKLIQALGGKCQRCGYSRDYPSVYCFHHKDPSQKDFGISGKTLKFSALLEEAKKCMLLCHNCHMELHEDLRLF